MGFLFRSFNFPLNQCETISTLWASNSDCLELIKRNFFGNKQYGHHEHKYSYQWHSFSWGNKKSDELSWQFHRSRAKVTQSYDNQWQWHFTFLSILGQITHHHHHHYHHSNNKKEMNFCLQMNKSKQRMLFFLQMSIFCDVLFTQLQFWWNRSTVTKTLKLLMKHVMRSNFDGP